MLGLGLEVTYLGEFLKKNGVAFENLRIREYKSALTRFSDDQMDPYNREQLTRLLDSMEEGWLADMAMSRKVSLEAARGWLEHPISSARAAQEAGLIDKVAYEDELIGPATRPMSAVIDLLRPASRKNRAGKTSGTRPAGTGSGDQATSSRAGVAPPGPDVCSASKASGTRPAACATRARLRTS